MQLSVEQLIMCCRWFVCLSVICLPPGLSMQPGQWEMPGSRRRPVLGAVSICFVFFACVAAVVTMTCEGLGDNKGPGCRVTGKSTIIFVYGISQTLSSAIPQRIAKNLLSVSSQWLEGHRL